MLFLILYWNTSWYNIDFLAKIYERNWIKIQDFVGMRLKIPDEKPKDLNSVCLGSRFFFVFWCFYFLTFSDVFKLVGVRVYFYFSWLLNRSRVKKVRYYCFFLVIFCRDKRCYFFLKLILPTCLYWEEVDPKTDLM